MKVLSVLAVVALLSMPAVQGCAPAPAPKPQVKHEVVPVKQKQIIRATLVEGRTTKQQVVDALGTPETVSPEWFHYSGGKDTVYQIDLTQGNGTHFNVERSSLSIRFDEKKKHNIVSEVHAR